MSDTEWAVHELLLRLAGRLPDDILWRFRDWAASDAVVVLARALPRALLHGRVGLTDLEQGLLADAVLSFTTESPDRVPMGDSATAVLSATLRGRLGVGEVRSVWRQGSGDVAAKRIMLVAATTGHARLAGEVQRVLRALGEHDPCVEVLPLGMDMPPYHRAALAASELVCTGAEADGHLVPV
jgi:hypothetical protein